MTEKSPDAYRTISEVAEDLELPQHVLRFWETRFSQIKPLKRGGGRRYYRPDDVELLKSIRHLLYHHGYTIKGVQRILKENGPKAVQAMLHEQIAPPPEPDYAEDEGVYSQPLEADEDEDEEEALPVTQVVAPQLRPISIAPQPPPPPPVAEAKPVQRAADAETSLPLWATSASPQPSPPPVAPQPVVRPQVAFTRGGLRPVVVDEGARSKTEIIVPKSQLAARPPAAETPPDVRAAAPAAPPPANSPALFAKLGEEQRRSLQAALFELSECRRSLQKLMANAET